jgi:hypothetical protein
LIPARILHLFVAHNLLQSFDSDRSPARETTSVGAPCCLDLHHLKNEFFSAEAAEERPTASMHCGAYIQSNTDLLSIKAEKA